ncbi:MAG: MBL fold metallo-hydrolase, partial [Victivallales bacterium]|nr:MBL fold metallo-hydrolase [Victivallales bacterium]
TMVRTKSDSKTINHIKGSAIIIAGAGMCTGGRIKHHLAHHISDRENTVLFVGYQAENTLGRDILDGNKRVRILGEEVPVKAKIAKISGFSAHADKQELCEWLETNPTKPRHVFVTHGEVRAAHAFARLVKQTFGWTATVPKYETVATLR